MPKEWKMEWIHGQLVSTGSRDQKAEFLHSSVTSGTLLNYKFLKGRDLVLLIECISIN